MQTLSSAITIDPASVEALEQAIVRLCGQSNSIEYELLVLIREFDERAGWLKWGLSNCSEWVHWRCDWSLSTAREKVRVAHALKRLPEISHAFAKGRLSYSKARALTRVANVDNEASLLEFALKTTTTRVEERCQQMRNVSAVATAEAQRNYASRSLRSWHDVERGTMTITIELPMEEGALIQQALDKAVESESLGKANDTGPSAHESWSAVQADAAVAMAKHYLSGELSGELFGGRGKPDHGKSIHSTSLADQYQVIVHVDRQALHNGEGRSDLPLETTKRLCCDGSVLTMVDDEHGKPLNVGRKQRTVPAAIKRALWSRDKGCAYPGCTHTRFVDAHHIRHWADGGETSLDNTMLLCSRHHRLVHEGGYRIEKDHKGNWFFVRADGRAVPEMGYRIDDYMDDGIEHAIDNTDSADFTDRTGDAKASDDGCQHQSPEKLSITSNRMRVSQSMTHPSREGSDVVDGDLDDELDGKSNASATRAAAKKKWRVSEPVARYYCCRHSC